MKETLFTKIAARKLLDKSLGSERCSLLFEGFGVNHLHAKLYPMFSTEEALKFNPRNKTDLTDQIAQEILGKILV